MQITEYIHAPDRRLVGFKFVSFLKKGVDLTHRRYMASISADLVEIPTGY